MRYKIVEKENAIELEQAVQELLDSGYQILGNLNVSYRGKSNGFVSEFKYTQAVWAFEKDEEKQLKLFNI